MEFDLTIKCRGCLAEEPEMHNIFNLLSDDLTLANILSETTSIQIDESEDISSYLCIKCTEIVVDFYNFKVQFAKSQTYFQNELEKLMERFVSMKEDTTSEHIIVAEENEILDNIRQINEDLQHKSKENFESAIQIVCSKNLPTLAPCIVGSNNENTSGIIPDDALTEINKQLAPEVGVFTVQNELVQLIESVVFCCKICSKDYLLKDDFLEHMNGVHGKDKVDPSKFTKKTLVKFPLSKVREENGDFDFELDNDNIEDEQKLCKFCNTFILKAKYVSHHDEHKTHVCGCGAKFLRKSHLGTHERSAHSDERLFVCNYCNKAFKVKQSLTKHTRYHTHPRSEICHICGQIFNDKSVLSTHIKLKHFPTRDFQCSHCGLKFPLKSTLFRHTNRHHTTNRKRNFICTICNITYYDKSTLNRHLSVKHSDQPVKPECEYCGKTFTTKGNLYKHLRTSHKCDRVVLSGDGSIIW